jgi:uncharacterized protein (DUF2252 family)
MMVSPTIWQRIEAFNQPRPLALRKIKYQAMAEDPFSFFRGTCHLFHEDWPQDSDLDLLDATRRERAPQVWVCGDLHLENFGTYKGEDRQVYFGINDFDEGTRAALTRDLARLAVSILLVGKKLDVPKADRLALVQKLLKIYLQTLASGESLKLSTASGIVGQLLQKARDRRRQDLLEKYAVNDHRLQEITDKLLPVEQDRAQQILAAYQQWAAEQSNPNFYECLDIKQRIAGLGSLGIDRYLLLVAGQDSENRYLLDLKEQRDSSLQVSKPPVWPSHAQRVLGIQSLLQPQPPALRGALEIGVQRSPSISAGDSYPAENRSFTIRELQPSADKIKYTSIDAAELGDLVQVAAQITAWSHLHGAGQREAATVQQLIDFAANPDRCAIVLEYAQDYAKQVRADFEEFKSAFERVVLDI